MAPGVFYFRRELSFACVPAHFWVHVSADYWMYVDDPDLVKNTVSHTRTVLDWYASHLRSDGLLGKMTWWEFADWTANYRFGVPPQDNDGGSTYLTLQFLSALQDAMEMEERYGSPERVASYRAIISKASNALNRENWDPQRGLYSDTPSRNSWSQEANILAVMTGVAPAERRAPILRRLLVSQTQVATKAEGVMVPAMSASSYYFRFYLSRALEKAGLGDLYLGQLAPWYHMLELGLSTWAETPEPTRSDCHAWSASPNFDLLTVVAGIHPATPGFHTVKITRHLQGLHDLAATMPHPRGAVHARYHLEGTRWTAEVTLPADTTGILSWKGEKLPLHAGLQVLKLP